MGDIKHLVLLSGGLDSAVLLSQCHKSVIALNITYGQKHQKEVDAAKALAQFYDVSLVTLDLTEIFQWDSNCTLLDGSAEGVPYEAYTGETPSTYVPYRNGLFLSVATSVAYELGCQVVMYGAHTGDTGAAYPDCSWAFIDAQGKAINEGTGYRVSLVAPFQSFGKNHIVRLGLDNGVPFELTWSCYEGGERPCGKCATCIDRAQAFKLNNAEDPLCVSI